MARFAASIRAARTFSLSPRRFAIRLFTIADRNMLYCTKIHVEKARNMTLCYSRLWMLLIDRGMMRTQMRLAVGISTSVLAKLSKGEDVNTSIFVKICNALGCGIHDIVDSVPREPRGM